MRIAIFTELYAPSVGGQEVFFAGLGRALLRRGHQLDVYCISHQRGLPAHELIDGIAVHRSPTAPNYTRPRIAAMRRDWTALWRYALRTRRIAQRQEHDFYLLNQWPFMHVLTLPRRAQQRALVHWCEIRHSAFFRFMQRHLPQRTLLNAAISDSVGSQIESVSGRPAMTLPSGLDLSKAAFTPGCNRSDILAIGRVTEHKNLAMLVDAFEILRGRGYRGRLKIAGDGPGMTALRAHIANSALRDEIDLLGFISETEKFSLMGSCEVLAMPSKREGFPHAISEAMSCGLPVVTADYPENGTKAVVQAFASGVVTGQSAAAFADGIDRLRDEWDLYSANGRTAAKTLDWGHDRGAAGEQIVAGGPMNTMMRSNTPIYRVANRAKAGTAGAAPPGGYSIGQALERAEIQGPGSLRWGIAALRRRWWLFALLVVAATALAVVYAVVKPPAYTATTQIIIEPRTQIDGSAVADGIGVDPMAVDSQVEVLKSRAIAEQVMRSLKLADDPEFIKPSIFSGWFGPHARLDRKSREEAAVETLAQNAEVHSLGLSSVISISYRDRSPQDAARIANAFANAYVSGQLAVKSDDTARLTSWLESRLVKLQANAAKSEAALREYQASNGLMGLQSSTGSTQAQQQISAITIDLSRASDDEAAARGKLQGAGQKERRTDTMSETLSSPVIQELKKERNEATARLAQLQSRYGSAYPDSIAEQRGIANIDSQMAMEVGRIHQSLQSALDVAIARTASLQASLRAAIASTQNASRASVAETQLRIQANADNEIYQKSLERLKQTIAQAGTERADVRIVSFATAPLRPSSTGRKIIVGGGILLGCAAGLIGTVSVELLGGGIYNPQQLAHVLEAPWLGSVPEVQRNAAISTKPGAKIIDVPVLDRESGFSEMLRGIIASEPFIVREDRHLAIMLTSTVASEGKSTTAIALGRTMALQGIRVLLVDCDLLRRSATTMLAGDVSSGIVEVIEGDASVESALHLDQVSGMHWIGIRKGSGSAGTFARPRMPQVLSELRERFDILLMDAAPLLATADARFLAMEADRLVIAVRWAKTRPPGVRATLRLLEEIGVHPSGAILTRIDLRRQSRMGDSDAYSYQNQYRSYRA